MFLTVSPIKALGITVFAFLVATLLNLIVLQPLRARGIISRDVARRFQTAVIMLIGVSYLLQENNIPLGNPLSIFLFSIAVIYSIFAGYEDESD